MMYFDDPRGRLVEAFAFVAEVALRRGDRTVACEAYAQAAELETAIVRSIPRSEARIRGVLAVSAAALWLKAGYWERAAEVTALLEHSAVEVRLAAAQALVKMGDARSAAALGRVLQKDSAAEVREACARGLGDLGGPDAVGPLTVAAEKDASSRVKYVAGESLRKLGFSKGTGTR